MSGGFGPARRLNIWNESTFGWTGCKVTLDGTYSFSMKDVAAGMDEGIMVYKFKDGRGNPFTSNAEVESVAVACREGSTSVKPR